MRRAAAAMVLLALLAGGCARPAEEGLALVTLDGRWDFDATAASAGLDGAGLVLLGEASFGAAAAPFAALDATAARHLGVDAPPRAGEVHLDEALARALGAAEGDTLLVRAVSWPGPRVTAAFEMDRVRACDENEAQLCVSQLGAGGETRLRLIVPPGASELRYHPDIVELGPGDYPAYWNGTFVSPEGTRHPFQTAAHTRQRLDPPGLVDGHVLEGEWTIEFTLDLSGTRARGAVAGFVTYRAPGFSGFDTALLQDGDAANQTARVLEGATMREASLRVARATGGGAPRLGALALLAPADAHALLGIAEGNATALVVRAGIQLPERSEAHDPMVRQLARRDLPEATAAAPAGVLWATPAEATLFETRPPPGGGLTLHGMRLAPDARLLSVPTDGLPGRLLEGGHWPTAAEARAGLAGAPHLVLASADLLREAGVDPLAAKYTRLEIDTALGPRTVFVMGAIEAGPARTVWASAGLLAAMGAPAGPRALEGGTPLAG